LPDVSAFDVVSVSVDLAEDPGCSDGEDRLAGVFLVISCGDENVVDDLGRGTGDDRLAEVEDLAGGGENVVDDLGGGAGDDRLKAEVEDLAGGGDCKVAALELDAGVSGNVFRKKAAKSGRSARTQAVALHSTSIIITLVPY